MKQGTMKEKSRAVCVLGMHRSGTSAITRTINLMGVELGDDLLAPQHDNPTGFWENRKLMEFHERVLERLGTSWDDAYGIDPTIFKSHLLVSFKQELIDLIHTEFEDMPLWGWKDPRTCLLLPLWAEVLEELNIPVDFIITIRNPLEVAESLQKRNGFTIKKGIMLWFKYTLLSLENTKGYRRVFVNYDKFLSNWEDDIANISSKLEINLPTDTYGFESSINEFITPSLRHNKANPSDMQELPDFVLKLYSLLTNSRTIDEAKLQYEIYKITETCSFFRSYYEENESKFTINYEINEKRYAETKEISLSSAQNFIFKIPMEGIANISISPLEHPAIFQISVSILNKNNQQIYAFNKSDEIESDIFEKPTFVNIKSIQNDNSSFFICYADKPQIILPPIEINEFAKIKVILKIETLLSKTIGEIFRI